MAEKKEYSYGAFRRELEFRSWGSAPLWVAGIILMFVLAAAIAGPPLKERKAEHNAQANVAAMFEKIDGTTEAEARQRRELATSILFVKRFDDKIPEFQDTKVGDRLTTIAKTGEPLNLHPVKVDRVGALIRLGIWWLLGMLAVASLKYGTRYWSMCRYRGYRLSYLPWNQRWAWQVPLRAPWLIPFVIGSFLWTVYNSRKVNKVASKK